MAVPVHLWLKDDAGNLIMGSSDVEHREGSIELRGLTHNLSIPVDGNIQYSDAWNERATV